MVLSQRRVLATLATFSFLLIAPLAAKSQTLAQWQTFGSNGDEVSVAASNLATGVSGFDLTRNGGLLPNAGDNSFNSRGWATNAPLTTTVVNTDAYVELGISIDSGYTANLGSLLMGSRSSGSGPAMIGVFTSVDGYASPIFTIDQSATFGGGTGFANSNIDLSSFTNLTGDFLVRFANVSGATTSDANRVGDMDEESTWRVGDFFQQGNFTVLQITGKVVPVPEPSTQLLLTLLAGVGILLFRAR